MENQAELKQFIPRKFPQKEKNQFKKTAGRKWTFLLLLITVSLSAVFWFLANSENGGDGQAARPSLTVSTPTPSVSPKNEAVLKVENLIKDLKGNYGVYTYNLVTKKTYSLDQNEIFPAASLMKLPVILTLFQEVEAGKIDLTTKYVLKNSDKQLGAGSMQYKPAGTVFTYEKMVELMGKQSDNTAFNVFRKILGDERIQKTIDELGMKTTSLKDFETTPSDMGLFFRRFYSGSAVSRQHRDQILSYITDTFDESRIPAGVPKGTRVAHKVGTDIGVYADAGVVYGEKPFILVIMTRDVSDKEAKATVPTIAKIVWDEEEKN